MRGCEQGEEWRGDDIRIANVISNQCVDNNGWIVSTWVARCSVKNTMNHGRASCTFKNDQRSLTNLMQAISFPPFCPSPSHSHTHPRTVLPSSLPPIWKPSSPSSSPSLSLSLFFSFFRERNMCEKGRYVTFASCECDGLFFVSCCQRT